VHLPPIGGERALATYSGVEVPNTACCQFHKVARDSVSPMHGAVSSCWGRSWGVILEYIAKQRLTHDFDL